MPMDATIDVATAMTRDVLSVGPGHTLRQVAELMASRRVGAVVVMDTDSSHVGICTERDILRSIAAGEDPDIETAQNHQTTDVVMAAPKWTLVEAADAMKRGGFRHLVVVDGSHVVGIISVRDILAAWS